MYSLALAQHRAAAAGALRTPRQSHAGSIKSTISLGPILLLRSSAAAWLAAATLRAKSSGAAQIAALLPAVPQRLPSTQLGADLVAVLSFLPSMGNIIAAETGDVFIGGSISPVFAFGCTYCILSLLNTGGELGIV